MFDIHITRTNMSIINNGPPCYVIP